MEQTIYRARLATILSRIEADPTCWNQGVWHCGTAHCLAGHAQIDAGQPPINALAPIDGAQWLGMSPAVAKWAFSQDRTFGELGRLLRCDLACEYDPDGFDVNGIDKDGFDRTGYRNLDGAWRRMKY